MFPVKKKVNWNRLVDRTAHISVPMRSVSISSMFEYRIPCSWISRLTPISTNQLEIRASRGSAMYKRVLTFVSESDRDQFTHIVRGLNTVGGLSSSLYARLKESMGVSFSVKSVVQGLEKAGLHPTQLSYKNNDDGLVTETSFFK